MILTTHQNNSEKMSYYYILKEKKKKQRESKQVAQVWANSSNGQVFDPMSDSTVHGHNSCAK